MEKKGKVLRVNQTIKKKIAAKKSKGATFLYVIAASMHFLSTLSLSYAIIYYALEVELMFLTPTLMLCYYYIVRELIYKMFHLAGYHAQGQLKSFGAGSKKINYSVFEKNTDAYTDYYQQRSKKHQFLYFMSFLVYRNLILFLFELNVAVFYYLIKENMIGSGKWELIIAFILFVIQCMVLEGIFGKYKNWFMRKHGLKIILIEHEFPIFMLESR